MSSRSAVRSFSSIGLVLLLTTSVLAQSAARVKLANQARKQTVSITAEELQEIRDILSSQQAQLTAQREEIRKLRAEIERREEGTAEKLAELKSGATPATAVLASDVQERESQRQVLAAVQSELARTRNELAATSAGLEKSRQATSESVRSGFGSIRFNGLLQVWGVAGNSNYRDTFRIRRSELKFSGTIAPKVRWTVMIDPAKSLSMNNGAALIDGTSVITSAIINQAGRILQDAYITFENIPHLRIDAGQLKIPLSLESTESSGALATMERALFMSDRSRGGSFGDIRDIGVLLTAELSKYATVSLGEYNSVGDRQNDIATNDQKATVGRLVVRPAKWIQIGASGAYSNGGSRPDRPRRDRLGAELLLSHRGFTLQSEWMEGKESNILRQGYYALARFRPSGKWSRIEPVFRLDVFDPDVRHESMTPNTVPERDYIAGVNWYFPDTHLKLQSDYVRKTFEKNIAPSRDMLFVTLQTSW